MSERDDADRLNRAWDDFVQRPQSARQGDEHVDPTIRDIHGMDRSQSPDPEFRAQLRKQLERQAAFRAGQQHGAGTGAATPTTTASPVVAPTPLSPPSRGARPIEILAIAALLALVGSAIFWAVDFRPTDDEPTATIELAATDPGDIVATPSTEPTESPAPSATSEPTAEPSATATAEPTETAEPTATQTPDPTATATTAPSPTASATATTPPTATATNVPTACIAVAGTLDGLLGPLAVPGLAPDVTAAASADGPTIDDLDTAFAGLVDCLAERPQTLRRLDVRSALQGSSLDSLESAAVGQDIDAIVSNPPSLTDHRTLTDTSAIATLAIEGEPRYIVLFVIDPGTTEWHVASLSFVPEVTPTAPPSNSGNGNSNENGNQGIGNDNSGSNSGNGGGSGSNDDDDGDDSGGDDDFGDDDSSDDDGGDDD